MDLAHVLTMAMSFIGIFFMLLTYSYIDKLEKIGCSCSEDKYRSFIKGYSLFVVVYLFITMIMPPSFIANTFGDAGLWAVMVIRPIFSLLSIVFIALAIVYLRKLTLTKCKCAEDVRREVLYIYYIVEIVLISFGVVIFLLESVVMGAFALGMSTINKLGSKSGSIASTISNPVKSLKKLPGDMGRVGRRFPKDIGKVASSLKKTLGKK
jgi:hypothetical protein